MDLPNDDERKNIFELHLKKRGKWNKDIDSIKLIKESKEYSGADIEAVIKDCIEKSFIINKSKIETEDLLNVIKTTKPMAISLKDKIEKLRETLAKLDVKNASRK